MAGALIAIPAAVVAAGLSLTGLPTLMAGGIVVAALVAVTGGLHEDGLADMADGLGAGGAPERRLTVMKDSRIGATGAATLALVLLMRAAGIGALLSAGPAPAAMALLAAGAVSRTPMIWVWHLLPPARADGLSAAAGQPSRRAALIGAGTGLLIALLALPAAGVAGVAGGLLLAAGAGAVAGFSARRTLGGQTGDVLGATQQFAEVAFLAGLLI